jgi:methylated-DNA-[protein]-cysteine S-methyltransferase
MWGMASILSDRIETPIGPMVLLARDGLLLLLEFEDATGRVSREMRRRFGSDHHQPSDDPFGFSSRVRAYFEGQRWAIDTIPSDGGGTPFEEQVWKELRTIPCGTTQSYGAIAKRLGDPNLARAVGTANGRNPIAIVVPCHRVIGVDGALVGYGGGLDRKKWLLAHEKASVPSGQTDLFGW